MQRLQWSARRVHAAHRFASVELPPALRPRAAVRSLEHWLRRVCEVRGLELTMLSGGWIAVLRHASTGRRRTVFGYNFPVNSASAALICCDKAACSSVLGTAEIPHIPHALLMSPNMPHAPDFSLSEQLRVATQHWHTADNDGALVVKPKLGTGGKGVLLCADLENAEEAARALFDQGGDVVVSPFVRADVEFRVVVFDKTARLCYAKRRTSVCGDGVVTAFELVQQWAQQRSEKELRVPDWMESFNSAGVSIDDLNEDTKQEFAVATGVAPDYVPPHNERICVDWRHNLGQGAEVDFDFGDGQLGETHEERRQLRREVEALAVRTAEALDMRMCSVDILRVPAHADICGDELAVLEVNSGVMLESLVKLRPSLEGMALTLVHDVVCDMFDLPRDLEGHAMTEQEQQKQCAQVRLGQNEPIDVLIVLNSDELWRSDTAEMHWLLDAAQRARTVVCADGGADRLLFAAAQVDRQSDLRIHHVIGDLDSLSDKTRHWCRQHGATVMHIDDQDTTDLDKCLKWLSEQPRGACDRSNGHVLNVIVADTCHSARTDQTLGNLHSMLRYIHQNKDSRVQVRLESAHNVSVPVTPGRTQLSLDTSLYGPHCGLIPLGQPARNVSTQGLQWNLAQQRMHLGQGLVSTCNMLASDEVHIDTSDALLLTVKKHTE